MPIEVNRDVDILSQEQQEADFAAIAAAAEQIQNSPRNAEAIFRANAAAAANTIVDLAANAINEKTRLDAAKYVVDRVMGRINDTKPGDDNGGAPWDNIYKAVVVHEPPASQRAIQAAPQNYDQT